MAELGLGATQSQGRSNGTLPASKRKQWSQSSVLWHSGGRATEGRDCPWQGSKSRCGRGRFPKIPPQATSGTGVPRTPPVLWNLCLSTIKHTKAIARRVATGCGVICTPPHAHKERECEPVFSAWSLVELQQKPQTDRWTYSVRQGMLPDRWGRPPLQAVHHPQKRQISPNTAEIPWAGTSARPGI